MKLGRIDNDILINKAKENKEFCLFPFTHVATKTDGSFKLCCRSLPVSNIQEESLLSFWNSDKIKEVRRKFLEGERPKECRGCWKHEDVGTRSMRQRSMRSENKMSRWNKYKEALNFVDPETFEMTAMPKTIEIKTSNICNLKCRMCHPVDSSSWAKDWKHIKIHQKNYNQWAWQKTEDLQIEQKPIIDIFDKELWFSEIKKFQGSLDVIEFAGGEPLLDPNHYKLLDQLLDSAQHIKLKYSTNLTRLNFGSKKIIKYWEKFKKVDIYVSLDGTGKVFDYIRTGATFSQVTKNIDEIKKSRVNIGELGIACTVQIYNISDIPKIIDYSNENNIHFHCHFLSNPKFLSLQILPNECKEYYYKIIVRKINEVKNNPKFKSSSSIVRHLQDLLKYMEKDRNLDILDIFKDYTNKLDKVRGTNFRNILNEADPLRSYFT